MDKVLITGADELVGANVAWTLADRCEVLAVSQGGSAPAGCRLLDCDPSDASEVIRRIEVETPRAVIHCGPLSRSAWDLAEAPPRNFADEIELVRRFAETAEGVDARLVVVSTDAVFTGPRMFHTEGAPQNHSAPSRSAACREAAAAIERSLDKTTALVIRTHAYGWGPAGAAPGYAERLWNALSAGESCEVDADRHATPILASDLAELVFKAIELQLEGVLHIAGAERTSLFRFAVEMALSSGFAGRQVRPLAGAAPRRGNVDETSLNTQLVRRQLGTPLPLLREGLLRFAAQASVDYRRKLTGRALAVAA